MADGRFCGRSNEEKHAAQSKAGQLAIEVIYFSNFQSTSTPFGTQLTTPC